MRKKRLGELLWEQGRVDELQLRAALGFHHRWGVPLGQVVVDMGFCTAQQVLELLAAQVRLPVVDLDAERLEPRLVAVLPVEVAEACRVVPLRVEGPRDSVLWVATPAPARPPALDEVARVTGKARVLPLLATDAAVSRAIDRLYYPHLFDARRPVEAIALPEADEALPLVTDRSEYLMLCGHQWSAVVAPLCEQEGVPVLLPLTDELPADACPTEPELPRVEVPRQDGVEPEPEVWVYGWGVKATRKMIALLEESGLRARVARTEDAVGASADTVLLAPLQSVDAVKRRGTRARLLLAGRVHDKDRALGMGAHTFLSGPLRVDLLLQAVHEHVRTGHSPLRQVG